MSVPCLRKTFTTFHEQRATQEEVKNLPAGFLHFLSGMSSFIINITSVSMKKKPCEVKVFIFVIVLIQIAKKKMTLDGRIIVFLLERKHFPVLAQLT